MFNALIAEGHDPYHMTLFQIMAFSKANQRAEQRRKVSDIMTARIAANAPDDKLSKFLDELEGFEDTDTLDLSD